MILSTRTGICTLVTLSCVFCVIVPNAHAQRRGDRFGLRIGAWQQREVGGTLGTVVFDTDSVYTATVDERAQTLPFVEIYGLFNLKSWAWFEISAGFSQRTDVEVKGERENPPDTLLLGEGRVDFIPLFAGLRVIRDMGSLTRPHNIYGRGGLSMLVAAEQPSAIFPSMTRGVYSEGTEAAFGVLIGAGGEYYLAPKLGLVGDVAYRLSDLNYTDNGEWDLSGFWASVGVTIRVR